MINDDGPSYLKVINKTNSSVAAYLREYGFRGRVKPYECEIYGVNDGNRRLEVEKCTDDSCDDYTPTKQADFYVEGGETHTIEVTDSYFNKK